MNPSGIYMLGACLLALLATGSAIKCYACATADPEHVCEDPFNHSDIAKHVVNCEDLDDDRDHNVCRKTTTIQYAVRKTGDTEEVGRTVSRYCGGPRTNELGCGMMYGDASETYECACDEDGCNSSRTTLANISTLAAALVGIALLRKLLVATADTL